MLSSRSRELEYHAARLLLLIRLCGSPVGNPAIKGRTQLAKLDFFLRYPTYLDKALVIESGTSLDNLIAYERENVETKMVRYKYGPWDNTYYSVLAYLISKDLITIRVIKNVEHFGLTDTGFSIVDQLISQQSYELLVMRARVLKKVFGRWSGSRLKKFIYKHFPEIVSLPMGAEI